MGDRVNRKRKLDPDEAKKVIPKKVPKNEEEKGDSKLISVKVI